VYQYPCDRYLGFFSSELRDLQERDGGNNAESVGIGTIIAGISQRWKSVAEGNLRGLFGKCASIQFLHKSLLISVFDLQALGSNTAATDCLIVLCQKMCIIANLRKTMHKIFREFRDPYKPVAKIDGHQHL